MINAAGAILTLNLFSGVMAVLAAIFWIRSSVVYAPAPKDSAGVGGLLGGLVVVKTSDGTRIDLQETLKLQSYWSSLAAIWAALSAISSGVALFLGITKLA